MCEPDESVPLRREDWPYRNRAIEQRHWRRVYVLTNAFEAAVAVAGVVSGVVYFADPVTREQTSISHVAHALAPYWSAMYALGGLLILIGLVRPHPRAELPGLSLLAGALMMNGVAITSLQGLRGIASAGTFVALGAACGARGYVAWKIAHADQRGAQADHEDIRKAMSDDPG